MLCCRKGGVEAVGEGEGGLGRALLWRWGAVGRDGCYVLGGICGNVSWIYPSLRID